MKISTIALAAVIAGTLVATVPAVAKPTTEEKITIKKFGQTWRVTRSTAVARCNASLTDPKRKNWNIYCEYVPATVAKNECQFLFWKTDCAVRHNEPIGPAQSFEIGRAHV